MLHLIAPPEPPPRVTVGYDRPSDHVHVRLWQIWLAFLTVLITTWLCTLGPVPAILALVTAKHVLVAILAMGLRVDEPRENAWPQRS